MNFKDVIEKFVRLTKVSIRNYTIFPVQQNKKTITIRNEILLKNKF